MKKILEKLIVKEIEEAISLLKKKHILLEIDDFNNQPVDSNTMMNQMNPSIDNSMPLSPNEDPSLSADVPQDIEDLETEEEKGPVDSTFDELKELSDQTEDITKIVKSLKANIQNKFEGINDPNLQMLIQKIKDEGSPIMKKALLRPELQSI